MRRGARPRRLRGLVAAGALAAGAAVAATAGAAEPLVARGAAGEVRIAALPPVMERPAVREQLTSGLTTSFVLELREAGLLGAIVGAARVDVRYELWDEVYLVAAAGADGERRHHRFADAAALAAWWRGAELVLAPSAAGLADRLRLRLSVIPFSASEQRDAQTWLTEALADPPAGAAEKTDDAGEEARRPLDRLFRVLLATSIARGTLFEEEWPVSLPEAAGRGRPASRSPP